MKGLDNLRLFTDKSSKFFISEYGVLIIALLTIIGFLITINPFAVNSTLDQKTITTVVDKLLQTHQGQLAVKDKQLFSQDELIQQLTDAVIAIAQAAKNPPKHFSEYDFNQTWQHLTQGNTKPARAYLASLATYQKNQNLSSQAAVTTQHQGSFTYLNSVDEAVKIYNESINLDPNNPMNQVLKSYIEARKTSTRILTTGEKSPVLKDVKIEGDFIISDGDIQKKEIN